MASSEIWVEWATFYFKNCQKRTYQKEKLWRYQSLLTAGTVSFSARHDAEFSQDPIEVINSYIRQWCSTERMCGSWCIRKINWMSVAWWIERVVAGVHMWATFRDTSFLCNSEA